ncbi:hypothetical protein ACFL0G_00280 [Candidatus Zixiibacteriota bacterium]
MNMDENLLERVEIKGSTEVPEVELVSFFKKMFPDRYELLSEHWRWLYRIDQFKSIQPPLVALLDDKVIGHVAQIPVVIKKGDQEKLGAWGVDGGVLPPYRKYGLGSQLMEIWIKQFPISLGFCTEALFRILLKQGWAPRRTTYALQLPFRPDRHPKHRNGFRSAPLRLAGPGWNLLAHLITRARTIGMKKVREVPLSSARLQNWSLLHHPEEFKEPFHIARTPEFLTWRLLDSPFRDQYRILESEDADVAAVVRLFQGGGLRRAQIVSLSGNVEDARTLHRFLGGFLLWAIDHHLDLIKMVSGDPFVVRLAHRWFPIKSALRFVSFCHQAEDREMMAQTDHLWELIDYDLDFLN